MPRTLVIKLDQNLPARASQPTDDELSRIWGGCRQENDSCGPTMPCCYQTINNTGSGHFVLTCIGFTSGNDRVCVFV